jgi:hypothetical protein
MDVAGTTLSLKDAAWICKILAVVISGMTVLTFRHPGHFPVAFAQAVLMFSLAIIPNRWLVSTRTSFGFSLLLTLIPLRVFIGARYPDNLAWLGLGVFVAFCLFGFLPLSLVLSHVRRLRGEKVTYA